MTIKSITKEEDRIDLNKFINELEESRYTSSIAKLTDELLKSSLISANELNGLLKKAMIMEKSGLVEYFQGNSHLTIDDFDRLSELKLFIDQRRLIETIKLNAQNGREKYIQWIFNDPERRLFIENCFKGKVSFFTISEFLRKFNVNLSSVKIFLWLNLADQSLITTFLQTENNLEGNLLERIRNVLGNRTKKRFD